MKRRLTSAPVFLQVMGLALAAIFAAQLVNFALLVVAPDPPPQGFSIEDASRALKGERVKLPNGLILKASDIPHAPVFEHADSHIARFIAAALARALNADPSQVQAELRLPRRPMGDFTYQVRRMDDLHHRHIREMQILVGPGGPPHLFPGEPPHEGSMIGSSNLLFPPFAAAWRQPNGHWRLIEPWRPTLTTFHARMLLTLGLTILLLAPLAYLLARRMTAPIAAFAEAAERLGADPNAPPMKVQGPSEVRAGATAFNEMQAKLKRYVEGRTEMLAAIAHDLKTPLTRLRFRADAAPPELRDKLAADVAEMDAMIAAVLAYVRGAQDRAAWSLIDLTALVQAAADDFADTGAKVTVGQMQDARVRGDTLALRRLVANLLQNAVKFAGEAEVSVTAADGQATIQVADHGPGLDASKLEQAFEPFNRAEPSRSKDTGGVGLGLPIARAIAREHGGEVVLKGREGGGLVAEAELPTA
jgi:signal transduction histidine kinase